MLSEEKKYFPATVAALAILLIGAWYLFSDTMNTFPAFIHAWTQTDRLALAMNFQENGFDFFHPATFNLLTKDGITQVDFPIHDYLVACISSFLKADIVNVFRTYNLLYSLLGLFFFFKLNLLTSKSPIRSLFAMSFVFTIPFFVYYQNGFLPSVPSFSNLIIGLYFVIKFQIEKNNKDYLIGALFITFAALARSPFLIFLVALLLTEFWSQLKYKKINVARLFIPFLGIILFLSYFYYNQLLAKKYGSMFLADLLYFKSFQELKYTLQIAFNRWGDQFMSPFHAILFLMLLGTAIYQFYKGLQLRFIEKYLIAFFLISSFGIFLFFLAFGQQFAEHDYYYIDCLLPLLSLILLISLSRVVIKNKWYTPVATLCGIFFLYFFSYAKTNQKSRYTPPFNDRIEYAYSVYKTSKGDLKKWGVKKQDTLFVLDANSTNMPFTIWKNKGYTSLNSAEKEVKGQLDSAFTYAILLDSFFISSSFKAYPELINELELVNTNGELSLYKKSDESKPAPFFENTIHHAYSNFDTKSNFGDSIYAWTLLESKTQDFGQSLKIEAKNEYTLSWKIKPQKIISDKPIQVLFLADFYAKDTVHLQIVCRMNDYYFVDYMENKLKGFNSWQKEQFHFQIDPKYFNQADEISFYFWNPKKNELFIDNVNFLIYQ